MEIIIIAAMAENRVIGKNNAIPWRLKEDMKRFRELTMGHVCVMGRKTWESLPAPLEGRRVIVVSRGAEHIAGADVAPSLDAALEMCRGEGRVFICGGESVYRAALEKACTIELTVVKGDYDGDTFFPEIDTGVWKETRREDRGGFSFVTLQNAAAPSNAAASSAAPAEPPLEQFAIYGDMISAKPFGGGLINRTIVSVWNQAGREVRYLHQRINENVFKKPDEVMANILRVTAESQKIYAGSKDASRRSLTVVPARTGAPLVRDAEGGAWRTYLFVERAKSLEKTESPADARFLGSCIGAFQKDMAGLSGLYETIPGFHDMDKRIARLREVLKQDPLGRAAEIQAEAGFLLENADRGAVLIRGLKSGALPDRVCHNDCKINNILVDEKSGEPLCVIDLDTVMGGTALYDSGDLIRTVTPSADENEADVSKVRFLPGMYEALIDGYLSHARAFLVPAEKELIAESGRAFAQIMAVRFLTDYVEGDVYYTISRPGHNRDRCRNQIALIKSMDAQWDTIQKITASLLR